MNAYPYPMPATALEAVSLALFLGLTAPTEEQSEECAMIAQQIADATLTEEEIELAKSKAVALAKFHLTEKENN